MIYAEETDFAGRWNPTTYDQAPRLSDRAEACGHKRVKYCDGSFGPRVRSIKLVPRDLRHLTLGQLHAKLSPDGKFRNT